ncbi:MAG: hypothetical protein JNK94_05840 [Hyphomonadaceae bacterium]|nr:hypothetical protein [Hyphomonadaceae bacterium]
MRRTLIGVGLAAAFAAPEAHAGAWVAPTDGQAIWNVAAGERESGPFQEASAYLEAPVAAYGVSVIFAPWVEFSGGDWRTEAVAGVKRVIGQGDWGAVAVQGGAYWQSAPPVGCGEGGLEARALGGASISSDVFVNVEAAARALDGGCTRVRLDLTAGVRRGRDWMGLAQVFYDAPRDEEDTLKAQLSLTRFTAAGRGFQFGLRVRLDGDDLEPALVVGYWTSGWR